jgi:DHA1 family tetracycline resistance protein-like MFS transporter
MTPTAERRALLPIFLIVLVDVFGLTLIIPLLAIYAEHFGATPLQATLLVSVYALCQLFSAPLLGQISDHIGRKPMLALSQIGSLLGFLLMARASALWMVFAARIIDGATAGNLPLAQAYIADHTAPERRTRAFAMIGIAFGLGFFIGPSLTGYLVRFGLSAPIYAAAVMSFASIVCTLVLLPGGGGRRAAAAESAAVASGVAVFAETAAAAGGNAAPAAAAAATAAAAVPAGPAAPGGRRPSPLDWRVYTTFFRRPVVGGLLLQFFFYIFAFSTFTSGFALFAERTFRWHGRPFGPREIGYLFAYAGLLGILLQGGLVGRLSRRFGDAALVSAGFLSLVAAYLALGLVHTTALLMAVVTVSSFGNGVLRPALTSLVTRHAGPHEQGAVLGVNQSLNSVAQILAPPLGGLLIGAGLLPVWSWVAGAACLAGWLGARRVGGAPTEGAPPGGADGADGAGGAGGPGIPGGGGGRGGRELAARGGVPLR